MQNLPHPSLEAGQHSQALQTHIQQECALQGGKITFKRFMELALYAPGLGYYSAGNCKFGPAGDFVTAPEISPLFGQSVSSALQAILQNFSSNSMPCILELGAGTGKLAADILENLYCLPEKYFILEISADLIERQKQYLQTRLDLKLFNRIQWLDQLPSTPFAGIIIANEVIDAIPVHKIKLSCENKIQKYSEYYVKFENNQFQWQVDIPSTPVLIQAFSEISSLSDISADFDSEINTDLKPWLAGLSECLTQGVMIFIDYGFPEHEYYHEDRKMGTLMCHYRHRAHDDVFQHIGLTDITAHVDFTALACAAQALNLHVAGFTTQGAYLLDNNLTHFAQQALQNASTATSYLISQQVQQLTSPQEMGELFKVMAVTKQWDHPLTGFQLRDHRYRL